MKNNLFFLLLAAACTLGSCQKSPSATEQASSAKPGTQAAPKSVSDAAGARAAVAGYLQNQSDASLYVLDSAFVVDVDTRFQVLVPRTDWAGRSPNRARFEVDKATGIVQDLPVK
ncbi:hypothetical protein GCM10023185_42670 [Hymenobacter saemangeumensis]|uniref:PepSY domain-containing protein n=1 Tax=Hymenobacter saemangeumensis TaxID=1084522 RepID=A0ABP8ISP2_9BACT